MSGYTGNLFLINKICSKISLGLITVGFPMTMRMASELWPKDPVKNIRLIHVIHIEKMKEKPLFLASIMSLTKVSVFPIFLLLQAVPTVNFGPKMASSLSRRPKF